MQQDKIYFPGDVVCENKGLIKGHGIIMRDNNMISCHLGKSKQINKLLIVEPIFKHRHTCEMGDIVIGRVMEIYNKKWKLDSNCTNETTLALSAINLPGVTQRRKIESDEMEMRTFYDIGDIVVCEVQKVNKSGTASLHTRSDKYGKLENGLLIKIPIMQYIQSNSKFIFSNKLNAIASSNGYVWLSGDYDLIINYRKVILKIIEKGEKVDLEEIFSEFLISKNEE